MICILNAKTEIESKKTEVKLCFELKNFTSEQIQLIHEARWKLRKAGVKFDMGINLETKVLEWQLDWSLKNARVELSK